MLVWGIIATAIGIIELILIIYLIKEAHTLKAQLSVSEENAKMLKSYYDTHEESIIKHIKEEEEAGNVSDAEAAKEFFASIKRNNDIATGILQNDGRGKSKFTGKK